jgi:hypothetical protein
MVALICQGAVTGPGQTQFGLGGRYHLQSPAGGPDWGIRFNVTLPFPA